ncbi:MAG: hypothetical protein AAGC63_00510 [Propionicimonas sp.]|nr:hypothetical protein [Propionicimonas sp.]
MELLDLGSGIVTPPWLPLLLVGVLLAVLALLYLSLRRHLGRIDLPDAPADEPRG